MRTEREMFDLILNIARKEERIRGVCINGSRTNPNVPKDIFQDYDIVYLVRELESFIEDKAWVDVFGERVMMQKPEELDRMIGKDSDMAGCYGYLIQFKDGNRLDLRLQTLDCMLGLYAEDKLTITLLDKDNALPEILPPSDIDYWVRKPTKELFYWCSNEFWWVLNNVAKGLWREEIPYVMDNLNFWIRPHLVTMLSWQAGLRENFSFSIGKSGKYLERYLSEDVWARFLHTYPSAGIQAIWDAVFIMCELFEETAKNVASELNFDYNLEDACNSMEYLKHVRQLPKDAKEVYA